MRAEVGVGNQASATHRASREIIHTRISGSPMCSITVATLAEERLNGTSAGLFAGCGGTAKYILTTVQHVGL